MANKIPVKAIFTGPDVTALGEFESADTIAANRIDPTGALTIGSLTVGSLAGFLFGTAGTVSALSVANRMKVGSFTRNVATATGTQAVTSVGFQPGVVLLIANIPATQMTSIGLDDKANPWTLFNIYATTAGAWYSIASFSIYLKESAGDVDWTTGVLQSLDSDGFTVSWIKNGNPTGTANIFYLALR